MLCNLHPEMAHANANFSESQSRLLLQLRLKNTFSVKKKNNKSAEITGESSFLT